MQTFGVAEQLAPITDEKNINNQFLSWLNLDLLKLGKNMCFTSNVLCDVILPKFWTIHATLMLP